MEIGNRNGNREVMSQINVTPLVDVMLVLLVIFMITAPMMQQGMQVNLPKASTKAVNTKDESVMVTIDKSGRTFINSTEVPPDQLKAKLIEFFASKSKQEVFLKADKDVPYGSVVLAMAEIKSAGIEKIGMLTEPPEKK
ncbi:MAG: protein TolR [Desulfuromonadales bacterium]|nr:protein TolR [Desulfuromonadales bacterium]